MFKVVKPSRHVTRVVYCTGKVWTVLGPFGHWPRKAKEVDHG